ncbi:Histone-lysine N-methyltransferase SMYD3 like protein [Argiope bruennichi]|uniref:Histone-lysine N-methyltransferase SMYD3 like protein n=1 Tax=Argiope bruennichi TaxID=94029 RepID=A0A8T0EXZ0_ARGBR|nr:Histone-lysine N-methyltransferase SMYD3 like protein [Argiope bruennichi]
MSQVKKVITRFKKSNELKRCSQCSFLYFCNKNCQTKAWEMHKAECKCIMKAKPNLPSTSLRFIALIIFNIKKNGQDQPVEDVYGRKVSFRTLMSHSGEIKKCVKRSQQIIALAGTLKDYIGKDNVPPPAEFIEIFGKMAINSFSIADNEMQTIGTGLYLGASVFDHSCSPNADVVFDGINVHIHAIKHIPHRDISKVYISYIEQLDLTEKRRNALLEQYYFYCHCEKCSTSNNDDLMTKLLIPEEKAKIHLIKFQAKLKEIERMKKSKAGPSTLYSACMDELASQDKILADTHIFRVKILEIAFDACVWINQWADAVAIGEQLLNPYRLYYGNYHPLLGIHLFKLGKIQVFLNLPSSFETLQQAENIIKVTHGETHPLYQDLWNLLQESEKYSSLSSLNTEE